MPSFCVVPLCNSRTTGHRFPTDKSRKKEWLVKIRRHKFIPSPYSRICKNHFLESDYEMPKDSVAENPTPKLKKTAVPSQFAWTKPQTDCAIRRAARSANRATNKENHDMNSNDQNVSNILTKDDVLPMEVVSPPETLNEVVVESSTKDVHTQCETSKSIKIDSYTNTDKDYYADALNILSFKNLDRKTEFQFYTGFDNYEHFQLVFSLLGPAVNHLIYFNLGSTKNPCQHLPSPANEFFLTLIKLRRNMPNKELAFRFKMSEVLVSRIFVTWINFLYCQLKEIQIWVPIDIAKQNMKVNGKECSSTVIIDCTEIKIEQPKNPVSQQQTYSSYKSSNTVKVLIGMSSVGTVTFVSDAYGGSISDRALFEKCGISNLLNKNDIVLADRGFQIQDLLALKDVKVNIPEFLKSKSDQLEPEQLDRSKKTSSNRIHIERIIGLGKTYRILKGTLSYNLVPLASRIIFVCFMLVNFRQNIM